MPIDVLVKRIHRNSQRFGNQFPLYGEGLHYVLSPNDNWLTAFWTGLVWLAYAASENDSLKAYARSLLPTFQARLDHRIHITHDLGFLFTLSACSQWQLTGDRQARSLALRAADELVQRYRPEGRYLQAWGEIGAPEEGGRAIIDTMMNIPLLFWATGQSGDTRYADAARAHADTTARYLLREDASTYHTYFFDQESGQPIGPQTHQGYADDSLWARGQGWAIFGFATAADWTGSTPYRHLALRAAQRFLAELPASGVPTWDLRLPDDAPHYPDTSAGAIAACGMYRLARLLDGSDGQRMRVAADRLLDALLGQYLETDPAGEGLLRGGTYHTPKSMGVNAYLICGDYFFLEALLMREDRCPDLWGPTLA